MQIDSQKIIDVLIEQRNEAQNRLAQMTAYARQIEELVKTLEEKIKTFEKDDDSK